MLTGDKLETAENIAFSCGLINTSFNKYYICSGKSIQSQLELIPNVLPQNSCLLVEGPLLPALFSKDYFMSRKEASFFFSRFNSVVASRLSPTQKAEVVKLISEGENKITLAVGDGANDTNMIKAAHIGVGIYGNEGLQAVSNSDFALNYFKNLWRIIFVHGRFNYFRIAEMIVYFYFKNVILAVPQYIFCFLNALSGTSIFDDFYISWYNLIFTGMPVVVKAVFEQDVYYFKWTSNYKKKKHETKVLEERTGFKKFIPYLYYIGQNNVSFNIMKILLNIGNAIIVSFVLFWVLYLTVFNTALSSNGQLADIWAFSIFLFTNIIIIANIEILFLTKFFTVFNFLSVFVFSLFVYFLYVLISDSLNIFNIYKKIKFTASNPIFYLLLLLFIGVSVIKCCFLLVVDKEIGFNLGYIFKSILKMKTHFKNKYLKLEKITKIIEK